MLGLEWCTKKICEVKHFLICFHQKVNGQLKVKVPITLPQNRWQFLDPELQTPVQPLSVKSLSAEFSTHVISFTSG